LDEPDAAERPSVTKKKNVSACFGGILGSQDNDHSASLRKKKMENGGVDGVVATINQV